MVKREEAEKFEAEKRKERMTILAARIGQTASGERFLDRVYEIGRPKPLHSEPEDSGEQDE